MRSSTKALTRPPGESAAAGMQENAARSQCLAARLAAELNGRDDGERSLTFGAYLTSR